MKNHPRRTTRAPLFPGDDFEKDTQFVFNLETQKLYRELKNEIKNLKIENKINEQISKLLERRLTELGK